MLQQIGDRSKARIWAQKQAKTKYQSFTTEFQAYILLENRSLHEN